MRPRLLTRRSARNRPSDAHDPPHPGRLPGRRPAVARRAQHHRAALRATAARCSTGSGFASPPVWTTSPLPATELDTMLAIAEQKGVDGLHARHLRGRYHPGGRSRFWLRVPVQPDPPGAGGRVDARRPEPARDGRQLCCSGRRRRTGRTCCTTSGGSGCRWSSAACSPQNWRRASATRPRSSTPCRRPRLGTPAGRSPSWSGSSSSPAGSAATGCAAHAGGASLDPADVHDGRWARPPEPAGPPPAQPDPAPPGTAAEAGAEPAGGTDGSAAPPTDAAPAPPGTDPEPPSAAGAEARRLEQHFVYNALNTIAALIRTDPGRARELLLRLRRPVPGRRPGRADSTLGHELAAVHGYLQLEQARFGTRLRVAVDVARCAASDPR